jgi:4-amino-4-deoxy-L-arabinose transferase-like glycosyltransferase
VGLVLTYILWGAVMKLRETRTRVIQLVLALGIHFSAYSATYALRNLFPDLVVVRTILPPLVGTWLPLAWACTLWRVPEEARLATARLAPTHAR